MRRESLVPVAAVLLGVAFAVVSFLVFVSGGNRWLIAKKLRLGALLLVFTAPAAGCGAVTCYDQALPDNMAMRDVREGALTVPPEGVTLRGDIWGRESGTFSFQVLDGSRNSVAKGELVPVDGAFDAASEEFELRLPPLAEGRYDLQLWTLSAAEISDSRSPHSTVTLTVQR
ncbi:MAG: hypothetical protein HY901_08175 [Deltaproteobacteria bacterium]|nr:hypothetical protein [Deltaproteobacteria bacterium]